VAYELK